MFGLEQTTKNALEALCPAGAGPIGVAVSGGSDSLGLLYLASDWAHGTGRSLCVMTVDHGLRAEAAQEAETVSEHARKLGWPHLTLRWRPPVGHVSQENARRARHGLLAGALRVTGGTHLLMGHTLDDQIETVAMRAARPGAGAGGAGIRVFAVSPVWPEGRDVFIARPCLQTSREELRESLRAREVMWAEDPSNENDAFERVRVRKDIAQSGAGLPASFEAETQTRDAQDRALASWIETHITAHEDGLIAFDPAGLPPADLAEGLAWLLMAAAGTDRRADRQARLELAADILESPSAFRARTLGGAWIAPRQGQIHIARDPGGVTGKANKTLFSGTVWDGRFNISESAVGVFAKPSAEEMEAALKSFSPLARPGWPRFVTPGPDVECLVPQRLQAISSMLDYKSLMGEAPI